MTSQVNSNKAKRNRGGWNEQEVAKTSKSKQRFDIHIHEPSQVVTLNIATGYVHQVENEQPRLW